jgi:FkbH-like protein
LYTFKPDFVLIATHWRDANLTAFSNNTDEEVRRVVHELQQLWKILLQRQPCRIIQHGFNLPAQDSYGHLSGVLPGGRLNMLREINRALVQAAPSPVALLDLDRASAQFGRHKWFDPTYWHLAKQYPSANALPLLVDHQVALIRAGLGLTKKVLALDLDNTLWGGVIGEDGLEGIRLGPPSAVGEAYQALQQYVLELKARGIVLVVCSKNNEEDAKQPFLHHDATVLHLDDFVVFRANWVDKPTNLRDIARMLNLGIDSFVFLDDNPVERALVRRELPEVAVPEVGVDPVTFVPTLDRGLYFEAWSLSQEDMERHESYRANVLRDELAKLAGSLEDFLADLQMEAEIGAFDNSVLARVVQLIGKTNQFNVTTRRYSEEQVRRMMASDNYWTQHFKLNDRFGDNGLIGVMIARQVLADLLTWEIDMWLMSCRVIGRQMEQFMLQTLAEAAQAKGVRAIRGVYIPTAKNAMVADLYPRLNFTKLSETANGEVQYLLDLKEQVVPRCAFIRPRNAPLAALPKIG